MDVGCEESRASIVGWIQPQHRLKHLVRSDKIGLRQIRRSAERRRRSCTYDVGMRIEEGPQYKRTRANWGPRFSELLETTINGRQGQLYPFETTILWKILDVVPAKGSLVSNPPGTVTGRADGARLARGVRMR
jgi:hypothetical protein